MKGLQTGIPLAVLAAVAKANNIGGTTAIDGNHGTDIGGSAGLDYNQAHNTGISNKGEDDHSWTANAKGHLGPHVGWPLRRAARDYPGGKTAIDGNGGADVGNSFGSSNDQAHNTGISNDSKDDHSWTENGKASWPFKRSGPETAIDGNGGADVGNSFGSSNDQAHNTGISNDSKDDHSWTENGKASWHFKRSGPETGIDGNAETDVGNSISKGGKNSKKPEWAKYVDQHNGETAIDGNGGVDVGGSIETGSNQQHNTAIKNKHNDDHSGTVNGKGEAHGWFRKRQGKTAIDGNGGVDVGNSKSSNNDQAVNTVIKNEKEDDHSVTKNLKGGAHHCGHCAEKRWGTTGIDGNGGADVGNSFSSSNDQAHNTGISNDYKDSHKVTGNGKASWGFKRWDPETAIDGNGGEDLGNGFSSSNDQAHNTGISNEGEDDHRQTYNAKGVAYVPGFKRSGPETGIGGNHVKDVGNDATLSYDQQMNTEILNDLKDDHSATANTDSKFGVPYIPFHPVKRNDPFPEVPHHPVAIGANHGKDVGNDIAGSSDQKVNTKIENEKEDDHSVTINGKVRHHFPRAYRPGAEEAADPESSRVESTPEAVHGLNTADAACATETRHVIQTVTHTVYNQASSAPAVATPTSSSVAAPSASSVATPSPSAVVEHMIMTSTLEVPESSSFHQIPVYVPQPSTTPAVASSSHAASSPASSSVSIPTSVDAFRPGASTSAAIPSPSSHSGVSFQGAGAQLTPSAGLMSAVAGVAALLAFVL